MVEEATGEKLKEVQKEAGLYRITGGVTGVTTKNLTPKNIIVTTFIIFVILIEYVNIFKKRWKFEPLHLDWYRKKFRRNFK